MITAHIPSGYVLARAAGWSGAVLAAAVIGASFPDLDLIWFYLIDERAFHHHKYWVHAPAFALACGTLLIAATRIFARPYAPLALAFAVGWWLHILLDAPVGGLMWLWPLSDHLTVLVDVPPGRSHWILNFVFHWSFLAELAIWAAAIALWWRR